MSLSFSNIFFPTALPPQPVPAPSQCGCVVRMNWDCSVAQALRGEAHVSVHTLVFMTDNVELPWCHCLPSIQIMPLLFRVPAWSQSLRLFLCDCLHWSPLGCQSLWIYSSFHSFSCDILGRCGNICEHMKMRVYILRVVFVKFSCRGTGAAPFVCSGAVETGLHVMMTFVPVCLWGYSSVAAMMTHFLSPSHTWQSESRRGGEGGYLWEMEFAD